jgi:glc operon protein GlcG
VVPERTRRQDHVTYAAAAAAIEAGLRKAEELGMRIAIVVTDANGGMVAVARMDGASMNTHKGALGKATASASLGRSTEDFLENRLKKDEALWRAISANPDSFIVPGGYPLVVDGRTVGAVGVSGGRHEDDSQVARAAMERFDELADEWASTT